MKYDKLMTISNNKKLFLKRSSIMVANNSFVFFGELSHS